MKTKALIGASLTVLMISACGGLQPVDAGQALKDAGAATGKLKTVSATLTFKAGTLSFRTFSLVSASTRVHMPDASDTTYTVRDKDVQIALRAVITGGHTYLQLPFTGFSEITSSTGLDIPDLAKLFDTQVGLPAVIPAGRNAKYLGAEKINGVDSHHVEATYTTAQIHGMLTQLTSAGDVTAELWIGGSDHLIRKALLKGPFGDGGSDSSVLVEMSAFDAPVAIATPTT